MYSFGRGAALLLFLLVLAFFALPNPVLAAGAVDQSYIHTPTGWNWIHPHMPIGESFTPTVNALVGVDVGIGNVLVPDQNYTPGFNSASYNYINAGSPIGQSFTPSLPLLGAVDVGVLNEVQLDQSFDPGFSASGVGWNWVQAHQPIGQSFTPSYPQLWDVQLGLQNVGPGDASLTLVMRQGMINGAVIAQQNFSLPIGGPAFVDVVFYPYPGLTVTPGQKYVLDLVGSGPNTVRWYDKIPAGYSGGTAITNGSPDSSLSYLFKTSGFGNTITMNIHWNTVSGPILASKTESIPVMDAPIMMRFNFTTPVSVSPGAVYVIELLQTPQSMRWYIVTPGGSYHGGTAITGGKPDPNGDYLFDTYGAGNVLIVSIRANSISGPMIGSTTATVPLTPYALFHVDFPGTIPLTPGGHYVIELNQTVQSMRWFIVDPGGSYPAGSAITSDVVDPNADYLFQTYGPPGITPTTLSISFIPTTLNLTAPSGTGTITVTLTPAVAGEPIALYYSTISTGNWTTLSVGHTDPTGKYTIAWLPPQTGTYYFRADFAGDSNYAGSTTTSAPNTMTVVPEFQSILVVFITVLVLSLTQILFMRRERNSYRKKLLRSVP